MSSLLISKFIQNQLKSFPENDHIFLALGIDNYITNIIKLDFINDEYQEFFPVGVSIIGLIFLYNDNIYEDFDSLYVETLLNNKSIIEAKSKLRNVYCLLIKEILHIDAFEFEDAKEFKWKDMSVEEVNSKEEISLLFCDESYSSEKIYLGYSKMKVELNSQGEDSKYYSIKNQKDVDLLENILYEKSRFESEVYIKIDLEEGEVDENNENTNEKSIFIKNIKLLDVNLILSFFTNKNKDNSSKINLSQNEFTHLYNKFINEFSFSFGIFIDNSYKSLKRIFFNLNEKDNLCIINEVVSDCFLFSITEPSSLLSLFQESIARMISYTIKFSNEYFKNMTSPYSFNRKIIFNEVLFPSTPLLYSYSDNNQEKDFYKFKNTTLFPSSSSSILHKTYSYPNNKTLIKQSSKLFNPHHFLPFPSNFSSTSSILFSHVKGIYEYYHYLQDNINDKGWGCAYRSFQCLYSWFFHNNILDHNQFPSVPSILDMQKTLVEIKDKDSSIIGSSKWIGAFEGCLILSELLKIEGKIIFCTSGDEVKSKAREISHHFHTVGSPIMIGGGQYAYTILGILYDFISGDCQYLILDPHYDDKDILSNVLKNGGISWKSSSLFEKGNFYNLLLPQIPQ